MKPRELDFKMHSVVNTVGVNTPEEQSYQNESLSMTEIEESKSRGERAASPQRKYVQRSQSEIYIKDTEMQDVEDLCMRAPFVLAQQPIMYAEASASDTVPSQTIPLTVDQTQMNYISRSMGQGDSIYVNSALFQQIQRLFMKAHLTQKGFTLQKTNGQNVATQHLLSLNESQLGKQPNLRKTL